MEKTFGELLREQAVVKKDTVLHSALLKAFGRDHVYPMSCLGKRWVTDGEVFNLQHVLHQLKMYAGISASMDPLDRMGYYVVSVLGTGCFVKLEDAIKALDAIEPVEKFAKPAQKKAFDENGFLNDPRLKPVMRTWVPLIDVHYYDDNAVVFSVTKDCPHSMLTTKDMVYAIHNPAHPKYGTLKKYVSGTDRIEQKRNIVLWHAAPLSFGKGGMGGVVYNVKQTAILTCDSITVPEVMQYLSDHFAGVSIRAVVQVGNDKLHRYEISGRDENRFALMTLLLKAGIKISVFGTPVVGWSQIICVLADDPLILDKDKVYKVIYDFMLLNPKFCKDLSTRILDDKIPAERPDFPNPSKGQADVKIDFNPAKEEEERLMTFVEAVDYIVTCAEREVFIEFGGKTHFAVEAKEDDISRLGADLNKVGMRLVFTGTYTNGDKKTNCYQFITSDTFKTGKVFALKDVKKMIDDHNSRGPRVIFTGHIHDC